MAKNGINRNFIHIVLVEPNESLNIGSVARAMMNLGFLHLHLVAPTNYSPERAAITACWATSILDRVQVHNSLPDALGDMHDVVGFSGRAGKNRSGELILPEWCSSLNQASGRVALVFGPEDTGLTQEHAAHCRMLVRIPSAEEYPSFNLAQAVLLVLAEITRDSFINQENLAPELPTANDFYQLERIIDGLAHKAEFYGKSTPQPVPFLVRSLLRRLSPDKREMGILLGLFGKIERKLDRLSGKKTADC